MRSRITVCLTNWMRPARFLETLGTVRLQNASPIVFVWNNGAPFEIDAAWVVTSSANYQCWPRWHMALFATTEFIATVDDDVLLNDPKVLEDAISCLSEMSEHSILGIEGVVLSPGKSYRDSKHIRVTDAMDSDLVPCDIVKGKFMLLRTRALRERISFRRASSEDDIAISGMLSNATRLAHACSASMRHRFTIVDAPHALWRNEGHYDRRDAACRAFFGHGA